MTAKTKPAAKKRVAPKAEPAAPRYLSDRSKAVRRIVDELGGNALAAKKLGEKQQNINNWIMRGKIPSTSLQKLKAVWLKEAGVIVPAKTKATKPAAAKLAARRAPVGDLVPAE